MNKYIDSKPEWQVGKMPELQDKIIKKFAIDDFTKAELAFEFGHFIKRGKTKGNLDTSRVKRALEILKDKGFVTPTKKYKKNGKGPPGEIWTITKKGINSLLPLLEIYEFQKMLFFRYNKKRKISNEYNIEQLRKNFEKKNLFLDHHFVNNFTFNKILDELKNNSLTKCKKIKKFLQILYILTNEPLLTEDEILKRVSKQDRIKRSISIHEGVIEGFILEYENKNGTKFDLSPFGFMIVLYHIFEDWTKYSSSLELQYGILRDELNEYWKDISSSHPKKEFVKHDYMKTVKKRLNNLIKNYRFFFPQIFSQGVLNNIPVIQIIQILIKLYLPKSYKVFSKPLPEEQIRILNSQLYMDEILRNKLRQEFYIGLSAFSKWAEDNNCDFPLYDENHSLDSLHLFLYHFEPPFIPEYFEIITIISNLNNDKIRFKIHGLHESWLKNTENENIGMIVPDMHRKERYDRFSKLCSQLDYLFGYCMQKMNDKNYIENIDEKFSKSANELLEQFKIENKIDAFTELKKIFNDIKKIYQIKTPLLELLNLEHKAVELQNKSRTTAGISSEMMFYDRRSFLENEDFQTLRNMIEFQFFTYLSGYFSDTWNKIIQNNKLLKWYKKWLNKLEDFKKDDQKQFSKIILHI